MARGRDIEKNILTAKGERFRNFLRQIKGFISMQRNYDIISIIPGALLSVGVVVVVDVVVGRVRKDAP